MSNCYNGYMVNNNNINLVATFILVTEMIHKKAAASRRKQRIFGKLVTTSGGRPGVRSTRRYDPNEVVSGEEADQEYVHIGNICRFHGSVRGLWREGV